MREVQRALLAIRRKASYRVQKLNDQKVTVWIHQVTEKRKAISSDAVALLLTLGIQDVLYVEISNEYIRIYDTFHSKE